MQPTPLLLPAPVERRCHLCDMPLIGAPVFRTGFVVVGATGRAFCALCLDNELPTRLRLSEVLTQLRSLHREIADLEALAEAAQHVPIASLREQFADCSDALVWAAEAISHRAGQRCAVCGCWQDEDENWHWYEQGMEYESPRRMRSWLADDLCSACLGQHTSDNTLAGQCDGCQAYTRRLLVRGGSQYAQCLDCALPLLRRKGAR